MKSMLDDYLQYHINNARNYEIDTHLDAAVWFADRMGLNSEERYWLSFLTAVCETTPTSIYLFSKFPSVDSAAPDRFQEFCEKNRGAMAFQYDVRWMLYKIGDVVSSYKALLSGRLQSCVIPEASGRIDGVDRFRTILKNFRPKMFGRYVMLLYTELLHHVCGLRMEAEIDPVDNHSVRSGLISAFGLQGAILCTRKGSKVSEPEQEILRTKLEALILAVKNLNLIKRHRTVWAIETTLCTYNKTLHGRRYLGFYRERQWREIQRLKQYTTSKGEGFDWSFLENYNRAEWGKWGNRYIE